jgi:glycolate oxidase FAD binding subunit
MTVATSDTGNDVTDALVDRVRAAFGAGTPLRIVGGDTKRFYGRPVAGEVLDVSAHAGVVHYDPAELVVTARAGTRLAVIEALLAEHGQHLPFEPPAFGDRATLGGTVAAALAGPARVARGPVRDYVLGARVLAGDGRVLRFGGEVMKNVAGYDVARLLAGSLGVLGVILDVSLKVLPRATATMTLRYELPASAALEQLGSWTRAGLPVTASCWHAGALHVRFGASAAALATISARNGGERLSDDAAVRFWHDVREHQLPFFGDTQCDLWRCWTPAALPVGAGSGPRCCIEWHGRQRWFSGDRPAVSAPSGGEVTWTRFRSAEGTAATDDEVFAPLAPPLLELHRALKRVFDPAGILNPGRLYAAL